MNAGKTNDATDSSSVGPTGVPRDIRNSLTAEQLERLEGMLEERRALHAVDYRASTTFCGRGFYVAFFVGPEARSLRRLTSEGHQRPLHRLMAEVAGVCLTISLLICMLIGASVIVLYVTKSVLGIDLIEGHTFLHDYFYWR